MDRRCFICEISLFSVWETSKCSFPKHVTIPMQFWTWEKKEYNEAKTT
jgi:hypothetical protein